MLGKNLFGFDAFCDEDGCGFHEYFESFDNKLELENDMNRMGWISDNVEGVQKDFCSEECYYNYKQNRS